MFRDVVEHVMKKRTLKIMMKFLQKIKAKWYRRRRRRNIPLYVGKWCNVDGADSCLESLDYYFTYCVEWSPHGMSACKPFWIFVRLVNLTVVERNVRYLHMTFTELYKSFYLPYTKEYNKPSVTIDQFCRLR